MTGVLAGLLAWGALGGCRAEDPSVPEWAANTAGAEVTEVVAAPEGRLYLHVLEGPFDFWASVPADAVAGLAPGGHVWLGKGKEKVVEVAGDRKKVIVLEKAAVATPLQLATFEKLPPPEGGLAIGELFARKAELSGKEVALRGRIWKASYDVFETNWYHLRDGSGAEADHTNDVTVTSTERFEIGEVAVARGVLTVDKDLGFGYFYPAILEDGALTVEGPRRAPPKEAGPKKPAFPGAEGPPPPAP